MPYYKKWYNLNNDDFPESYKSFEQVISLPIWPGMEEIQVEKVIAVVKTMAGRHGITE
jgi:dTDP-4-amino-4,6-dideoxygalactose transaminase